MTLSGQPLLLLLFFNAMLVVFLGSLVFFCEVEKYSVAAEYTGINGTGDFPTGVWLRHDKQYEGYEVSPFRSIPYAFWFVCVTMTTVGYGDYTPTTWGGKLVAVFTFYVGIVFLALPIGILSQNFELVYERFCESQGVADFDPEGPPRMRDHKRQSESRVAALFMGNTWFPNVGCFRRNVFLLFHEPLSGKMSAYVGKITMGTILLSIVTFVLETMPEFKYTPAACTPTHLSVEDCTPKLHDYFYSLEVFLRCHFYFRLVGACESCSCSRSSGRAEFFGEYEVVSEVSQAFSHQNILLSAHESCRFFICCSLLLRACCRWRYGRPGSHSRGSTCPALSSAQVTKAAVVF